MICGWCHLPGATVLSNKGATREVFCHPECHAESYLRVNSQPFRYSTRHLPPPVDFLKKNLTP